MILEVLYSNVANLYGDLQNVKMLKETLRDDVTVVYTEFYDTPYFVDHHVDMIYMGTMMEKFQKIVIDNLLPYKNKINQLIENGTIFLITGNALEIFGKSIDELPALNIFNFTSKHLYDHHHNSCYLGEFEGREVTGFKSHFSNCFNCDNPLFKTIKGFGFNDDNSKEGVRKNNFFGTYLIGPILVMNPYLTHYLLKLLNLDRELAYEQAIIDAYNYRVNEFKGYTEFKEFKH